MATDYQRLEQRANAMRDALLAFVAAAKDVQDTKTRSRPQSAKPPLEMS